MLYHNIRYRTGPETVTLAVRSDNRYESPIYDEFLMALRATGLDPNIIKSQLFCQNRALRIL